MFHRQQGRLHRPSQGGWLTPWWAVLWADGRVSIGGSARVTNVSFSTRRDHATIQVSAARVQLTDARSYSILAFVAAPLFHHSAIFPATIPARIVRRRCVPFHKLRTLLRRTLCACCWPTPPFPHLTVQPWHSARAAVVFCPIAARIDATPFMAYHTGEGYD
jgi:hypothetical protein